MLVIGSGGLALQILHDLEAQFPEDQLYFFDDVTKPVPKRLFGYPVLGDIREVEKLFQNKDNRAFCLGLSGPGLRRALAERFMKAGGICHSLVSNRATEISRYAFLEVGVTILPFCLLEPGVQVGSGCLVNAGCFIHHNSIVGEFCELGPGVKVLGDVEIGDNVFIGANAVILPKVKVGNNATIGAGAVVTKDVFSNQTVGGIPAKPLQS